MKTNSKGTKAVAKATKTVAKATKATKKAKTPKVVESDEVILDAKSDITAVADNTVACKVCENELEQTEANFSPLQKGGFSKICKPCQTKASLAWTTKRADYRKQYQRAVQLINLGIPAIVPNAKDWKQGDVIMTVEYTDKNGEFHPSVNAETVYTEMKQAQADARAELKAQREADKADAKAKRAEARAELKAQREADKADAKAKADAERAEKKKLRDAERAEKAEQAKLEREQKAVEKAEERKQKAAEKAEEKRIERENKALAKAEAAKQKAIEQAEAVAKKAEERKQAAIEKALAVAA